MKEPSRLKKIAEIAFFVSALVCLAIFVPSRLVVDKKDLAYTVGLSIDDDRILLPSGKIVYIIDPSEQIEPGMEYVTFRGISAVTIQKRTRIRQTSTVCGSVCSSSTTVPIL